MASRKEQNAPKWVFPTNVLLNVVLGIGTIGGVLSGVSLVTGASFGIITQAQLTNLPPGAPTPQAATDLEKICFKPTNEEIALVAIGMVCAAVLKARIGPEDSRITLARYIESSIERQNNEHNALWADYLKNHKEEVLSSLSAGQSYRIPRLYPANKYIVPTEPLEVYVDDQGKPQLRVHELPRKYCRDTAEFHFP